jgi:hypothetical protein
MKEGKISQKKQAIIDAFIASPIVAGEKVVVPHILVTSFQNPKR